MLTTLSLKHLKPMCLVHISATCAPGYFSADGFQPCELCKLGEYQSNSGSKSCNRCPNDRRCTRYQGASSLVKCGCTYQITEYLHTEVSLLRENRKVVFTKIAGGHVRSKCPKERHSPPPPPPLEHYISICFQGVTVNNWFNALFIPLRLLMR